MRHVTGAASEIRQQLEYENSMTGSIGLKNLTIGFIFYITEKLRWKLTVHREKEQ